MLFISCRKDTFISSKDAILYTSVDTLLFDTVFTSVGSVTKSFKIINGNDQKLHLTKVKLMGGSSSFFNLNIDGISAMEANNIDIAANDSIYVFVQVNISPRAGLLPFVIADSVLINFNGNNKFVQLQAYGQNANFIRNKIIKENVTWDKSLPYVIIGGLQIDPSSTLTISPGTRIYCHADAPFLIDGTLIVNGTKQLPVIFKGDRLDADYSSLPAAWPGLYFRQSSKNNYIKFAYIQNAYQAVVVIDPTQSSMPKLLISQSIIDNAFSAGIIADNSSIQADNSLVSNCGNDIIMQGGGNYKFINCTIAAYSNYFIEHKHPVLQITNISQNVTANLDASFVNCIFWGDSGFVKNEIIVNKQGNTAFRVNFDHDLMRVSQDPANSTLISVIKNKDPNFDSLNVGKRYFDFHITRNVSSAIKSGIITIFNKDLDDKIRSNGSPDLGCYEK